MTWPFCQPPRHTVVGKLGLRSLPTRTTETQTLVTIATTKQALNKGQMIQKLTIYHSQCLETMISTKCNLFISVENASIFIDIIPILATQQWSRIGGHISAFLSEKIPSNIWPNLWTAVLVEPSSFPDIVLVDYVTLNHRCSTYKYDIQTVGKRQQITLK